MLCSSSQHSVTRCSLRQEPDANQSIPPTWGPGGGGGGAEVIAPGHVQQVRIQCPPSLRQALGFVSYLHQAVNRCHSWPTQSPNLPCELWSPRWLLYIQQSHQTAVTEHLGMQALGQAWAPGLCLTVLTFHSMAPKDTVVCSSFVYF